MSYEWANNGYELLPCDCCEQIVPTDVFRSRKDPTKEKRLCELCSCTYAGTSYEYDTKDFRVLQTICVVGNILMQKLGIHRVYYHQATTKKCPKCKAQPFERCHENGAYWTTAVHQERQEL